MTDEGEVKKLIKAFLNKQTIPYRMIIPSAFGNTTGMSDFCCILSDGKWLAIEAKALGKKATPLQQKFLNEINENNGFGVVVDGEVKLKELEDFLSLQGYLNE